MRDAQALNFCLDVQELADEASLCSATFEELVNKYEPSRKEHQLTFPDGSQCTWIEKDKVWRLDK
jgi:hypothetical protein